MKHLLWLDDNRNPFKKNWIEHYAPGYVNGRVIWVRNYNEFVTHIERNGLPDKVAFDHDLADEHMQYYFEEGGHDNPPNPQAGEFVEKTGYDAAKWLVDYCEENSLKFPEYVVQSANPVGKKNIIRYIENAKKHLNI